MDVFNHPSEHASRTCSRLHTARTLVDAALNRVTRESIEAVFTVHSHRDQALNAAYIARSRYAQCARGEPAANNVVIFFAAFDAQTGYSPSGQPPLPAHPLRKVQEDER